MRSKVFLLAALVALAGWPALGLPIVTSFSPQAGGAGDTVTLYGSGFTSNGLPVAMTVTFWNGLAATITYVSSDSIMTVQVPTGITTGPIGIRQGSNPTTYTVDDFIATGAGPYILSVTPGVGAVNDQIVLSGAHFTGVTTLKFNGLTATNPTPNGDGSSMNVYVPGGATSGFITVTTSSGTATSPAPFTVIGPGPYISGFTPTKGAAGTTVHVFGRFLTSVTAARFSGVAGANLVPQGDTQLQVDAPGGVVSGPISVTNTQGTYTTPTNFFVPPIITGLSPGTGPAGSVFNINGTNFLGVYSVTVSGVAASFSVANNNTIAATAPLGLGSGPVRVYAPAGSYIAANNFRYAPALSGFSPPTGAAGTTVIITGTNLNEGLSAVKFNNVSASFSPPGYGAVTSTVPAGATTGPLSLTTSNGTVTTAALFYLPPAIASFTPSNGPAGTAVTLTGTNFLGASFVTFNGAPAVFTAPITNTTLQALVPSNFFSGPLTVTAPAGTATSAGFFYAPPAIAGFSPVSGLPGTVVTISGTNLAGTLAVKFNGSNATSVVNVDNFTVRATVPAGAQNGPITVIGPAGTNTSAAVFTLNYASDVGVTMTDSPDPVTVSNLLTYTMYVNNYGPFAAPNVRLTNQLPSGVVFQSVNPPGVLAGNSGNAYFFSLGTVGVQAPVTITLTAKPTLPGTIVDTATVGSDYLDGDSYNNSAISTTTVEPPALLSVALLPDNEVAISWSSGLLGYVLEYKSTLSNNASWTQDGRAPVLTNGQYVVIEPLLDVTRFYRLQR